VCVSKTMAVVACGWVRKEKIVQESEKRNFVFRGRVPAQAVHHAVVQIVPPEQDQHGG
jgi:hypothetical protein